MKSKKLLLSILYTMLIGAIILIATLSMIALRKNVHPIEQQGTPVSNMIVSEGNGTGGITLTSAYTPINGQTEDGISPASENVYTLTATVNEDASVKAVKWEVKYTDGSALDEGILNLTERDLTLHIECLAPFEKQITVKAISKDNEGIFATCLIDYISSIESIKASVKIGEEYIFQNKTVQNGGFAGKLPVSNELLNVDYVCNYSKGSIHPDFQKTGISIKVNEEATELLRQNGYEKTGTGGQAWDIRSGSKPYFSLYSLNQYFGIETDQDLIDFYNAIVNLQDQTLLFYTETYYAPGNFAVSVHQIEVSMGFTIDPQSIYKAVGEVELDHNQLYFGG